MIYKYNLGRPCDHPQALQTIEAPSVKVKKILDIQLQDNCAVLWAEVEPQQFDDYIRVMPVWTGYSEPKGMEYISTIQETQTGLVYHYYVNSLGESFDV